MSYKKLFLLLTFFSTALFASATQKDAQGTVEVIKYLFETKYAPLHFKEQTLGWNLDHSIAALKQSIAFSNHPQWLLRKFFLQPADYHLTIVFHSSSYARLPVDVKKVGHGLYISWIDPQAEDLLKRGVSVGDEILYWDGVPALEVFNLFKATEITGLSEMHATDSIAEIYFSRRLGQFGMNIPRGEVQLTLLPKGNSTLNQISLQWSTERELFPYIHYPLSNKKNFSLEPPPPTPNPLLNKSSCCASIFPEAFLMEAKKEHRNFAMGSKRGFLPLLGPVVSNFKKAPFFYYIYVTPEGHKAGYLRIGSFEFDRTDLIHLKKVLKYFEKHTDGLVLDVMNNPGGVVLNLMSVISYLIDFPVRNYEQTEIMTSEELELAVGLKSSLEYEENEEEILRFIKRESQYNPGIILAKQFLAYANFLLESWERGGRITPLYPILGIDQIYPDQSFHYSKPILLLVNHLSLSCADFFPGLLQENDRALIMGQTTGGAGGIVTPGSEFPNQLGIKMFVFTSSLVYKHNGECIENKGITPDIPYEISVTDIQNDFSEFSQAINQTLDQIIQTTYTETDRRVRVKHCAR